MKGRSIPGGLKAMKPAQRARVIGCRPGRHCPPAANSRQCVTGAIVLFATPIVTPNVAIVHGKKCLKAGSIRIGSAFECLVFNGEK